MNKDRLKAITVFVADISSVAGGIIGFYVLVALLFNLVDAVVMMQLWNWFVASQLHVPELGYFASYGLMLICYLLREYRFKEYHRGTLETKDPEERISLLRNDFLHRFLIYPSATLVLGWIIHFAL